MKTAVWAHILLFLLSASSAIWVWDRGGRDNDISQIRVLKLKQDELISVSHFWPGGITALSFSGSDRSLRLDLTHVSNAFEAPADTPPTLLTVPPSSVVLHGLDLLTPLWAQRRIASPNSEKLRALGFDDSERRMEIKTQNHAYILRFGRETYGGEGRYLMLDDEPDVYLVSGEVARNFEGPAKRLTEAKVMSWPIAQISKLSLKVQNGTGVEFLPARIDNNQRITFTSATDLKTPLPAISTMLAYLDGLYSTNYQLSNGFPDSALLHIQLESARQNVLHIALAEPAQNGHYPLHVGPWLIHLNSVAANRLIESVYSALPASTQ